MLVVYDPKITASKYLEDLLVDLVPDEKTNHLGLNPGSRVNIVKIPVSQTTWKLRQTFAKLKIKASTKNKLLMATL